MNARVAKEAMEHVCNILAFYGIRSLNPETFRQAKLGNNEMCDRLWVGLFQLIVLNFHNFRIRLTSSPINTPHLQSLVTYALSKYKCPFHLTSTSHTLLLAFGYLISHIDLFSKYDSNFPTSPTSFSSLSDLNSSASSYIKSSLNFSEPPTWNSLLSTYKSLVTDIRDTYCQMNYTAKLITKLHETDPSLDPEDLWVAASEERLENFAQIMIVNEKIEARKEEDYKHRAVFWKWLESVVDSVEDVNEVNNSEGCSVDFGRICVEIENGLKYAMSVYREISPVISGLDKKVEEVVRNSPGCESEFEAVFKEMSGKFRGFEESLDGIMRTGEIPNVVALTNPSGKDRGEGDVVLAKKVDVLMQELQKAQATTKMAVYKLMKSVPGVKVYNL